MSQVKIMMNSKFWLFVLFLAIVSRLSTSINYYEDIDSLRFALSAYDYDVLNNQPHFPGYPIYCFFLSVLFFITNSVALSSSIIGGFAVFLIIYFSQKINYEIFRNNSIFLFLIIFFNPFIWLMSNRYMPDLLGLSLLVSGFYYLIKTQKDSTDKRNSYMLGIMIGLLSGVRISFMPFFIPVFFLLKFKNIRSVISTSILSFLIWFIPWICITDLSELLNTSINDFQGHFYRWGGTVISDNSSFETRLIKVIESVFADSLGMWWRERHWITLINTIFLLPFLIFSFVLFFKKKIYKHKLSLTVLVCFTAYFIWAFLFQNIVYKPRHLMPFIPLSCFLISFSFEYLKKLIKRFSIKNILFLILVPYGLITLKLISQHKTPSAISQISSHITDSKAENVIIISHHLMNYYFSKSITKPIIYLNKKSHQNKSKHYYKNGYRIFSTSKLNEDEYNLVNFNSFYHNPYVNKLWSNLSVYEYEVIK